MTLVSGQAWVFEADTLPPEFIFNYVDVDAEGFQVKCTPDLQMNMEYTAGTLTKLEATGGDCTVKEK